MVLQRAVCSTVKRSLDREDMKSFVATFLHNFLTFYFSVYSYLSLKAKDKLR